MFRILILLIFLTSLFSCEQRDKLFVKLNGSAIGLNFENTISENEFENFIDYSYIYNGGGVAVGDINGDNLMDLYFTGNQTGDKLFLNKTDKDGTIRFEDITKKAGIKQGGWSTGVTMADVNADGKLDIYVCKSGNYKAEMRANQLYINQGNNTFLEQAKAYNLADTSYSTQAAFFDFDHDNDLDIFIITSSNNIRNPNELKPLSEQDVPLSADKLYENIDNKTFKDISKQAGIFHHGMSLGLSIADFNNDGWEDIFVGNDFLANDLFYLNNQNGTFSQQSKQAFAHHSQFSMGCDAADIDDDGNIDLISVDMMPSDYESLKKMANPTNNYYFEQSKTLGYHPQFMRNMLFLNQGNYGKNEKNIELPRFSEIAQVAGIHQTDWSWSPLIADFDNDGQKDIFISNGYLRDITNLDFITGNVAFAEKNAAKTINQYMKENAKKLPSIAKVNRFFRNKGAASFDDVSDQWIDNLPTLSNGAAYADLDNDGDLDLVVNNINQQAEVYQNQSKNNYLAIELKGFKGNPSGLGAVVELFYNNAKQSLTQSTVRGFQSSSTHLLHFGLGKITSVDSIKIKFNEKEWIVKHPTINQKININLSDIQPNTHSTHATKTIFTEIFPENNFKHEEIPFADYTIEPLLPHKFSQEGPKLAKGDINGDGLEDFFVAGAYRQQGAFFIQKPDGSFFRKELLKTTKLKEEEDSDAELFDADNDKDLDLYIVSGSNEYFDGSENFQDRLYLNDGKGNFSPSTNLPKTTHSGSVVAINDFDKDGDIDVFRGGRLIPTQYPKSGVSSLLMNENKRFLDITNSKCPDLATIGMVTDAIWTDLDNDSWADLVVVGELMPITIFKNEKGTLKKINAEHFQEGFWRCVKAHDIDLDGDVDLVVGNVGKNMPYQISEKTPYHVYGGDFDNNSRWDAITTIYSNNKEYPIHSFDVLRRQLPFLRSKFTTFAAFSSATFDQLLPENSGKSELIKKATTTVSIVLLNEGNFKFKQMALPEIAQRSCINDFVLVDVNNDKKIDLLTIENDYEIESFVGQMDASYGNVLINTGKGIFKAMPAKNTGFWAIGDCRAAILINSPSMPTQVIVSRNNQYLQFYKIIK